MAIIFVCVFFVLAPSRVSPKEFPNERSSSSSSPPRALISRLLARHIALLYDALEISQARARNQHPYSAPENTAETISTSSKIYFSNTNQFPVSRARANSALCARRGRPETRPHHQQRWHQSLQESPAARPRAHSTNIVSHIVYLVLWPSQ